MAILNLLYLQFTSDSKKLKGLLFTIYNQRILTPYSTCKSLKIVIFLVLYQPFTPVFIYLVVQLAVRNTELIFHHREYIELNVLCSILQKM